MSDEQILSLSILGLLMAVLILDRFRYDIVAVIALLISVAVGIVNPKQAFSGFSNDIVIIVGSALLVSAGVARSGIMENLIQRIWPDTKSVQLQLAFLIITVTILSAFVKNIGALAMMLPIAFQFARRSGTSPSVFLMPMAYSALLGGLMTQIGTSPNIVVSQIRERMTGQGFSMFDYMAVGSAVAGAGVLYLIFFYWLLPIRNRNNISQEDAIEIRDYISEATVPAEAAIIGKTLTDLMRPAGGEAMILRIIRNKKNILPLPDTVIAHKDVILFEGSPKALDAITNAARLELSTGRTVAEGEKNREIDVVEAVITDNSPLIGISAKRLALFDRYDANLLAVSRQHERIRDRLGEIVFRLGDIIVLQGRESVLPNLLRELKCLPLARRTIMLGNLRHGLIPIIILASAVLSTALQLVPVTMAFFAAAIAMVVFRVIPGREIYQALDGQILVLLAALIPVSESLSDTGCAQLIGEWLAHLAARLPSYGALSLILIAAMFVTPFLNNAATVMVMAPVASSFATSLDYRPDAFLMAVAIGAACDFLTPIGHQCNMLVMGPGGYRFIDYPRLGLPLSVLIVIVAVPMIMIVWPL
ncbi:MAG: transporter Na+/sulfate symporter family protein [Candidatus Tokpelaia sp. JSC188]|nr:MAG: transporter Na+/sulfate symporter family protein [Candidatus Tokpelaia sp. JSC188]